MTVTDSSSTKYANLLDNFLKYVKINTRSDINSKQVPTTPGQTVLLQELEQQLLQHNLKNVHFSDGSFLFATLPANTSAKLPTIGLIAHVDTADFNAENIQPQIHHHYNGKNISLNSEYQLNPDEFPHLKNYLGDTLITTSGDTLLGADDKAGIAEIIAAVDYLKQHDELKHGDVKIAFGPDEEIGKGADKFNVADFSADFAYTLDVGAVGEINAETFNAAAAEVTISGTSVHPSTAKGLMVSAIELANQFHNQVPAKEKPEFTDKRSGFYFVTDWNATPDFAKLTYIIRDFDKGKFNAKKQLLQSIAEKLNQKYGKNRVSIKFTDQYYNMADILVDYPQVVDLAKAAIEAENINPQIIPFRGGTDGSKITFKGLPTPNITNGGENAHGRFEFVSLQAMEKVTDILIRIVSQ